jgi:hypothetical protein
MYERDAIQQRANNTGSDYTGLYSEIEANWQNNEAATTGFGDSLRQQPGTADVNRQPPEYLRLVP